MPSNVTSPPNSEKTALSDVPAATPKAALGVRGALQRNGNGVRLIPGPRQYDILAGGDTLKGGHALRIGQRPGNSRAFAVSQDQVQGARQTLAAPHLHDCCYGLQNR